MKSKPILLRECVLQMPLYGRK